MKYEIVTDSCANLKQDVIDKYNIAIVPLHYVVEGKEKLSYIKGENADLKHYYDLMRKNVPVSTSSACKDEIESIFTDILDEGKDILYIGMSSELSATFNVVSKLLNELRTKYNKQKIYHVDSLCASSGLGILVTTAACMREDGKSLAAAYDWVQDNKRKVCHLIALDSATYPYRGGRITKSQYLLANTLNIKPLLNLNNAGSISLAGKAFGRKNSLNHLAKQIAQTITSPSEQTIFVRHGDCPEDAEYFVSRLREKVEFKDVDIALFDPIIGAHSGPDTLAVFYMADCR